MIIEARYNGPPGSGNGGWTAGTVASLVHGPAVVTLRIPPPLETPLEARPDRGTISVYAPDGILVAEVGPADVPHEPIEAVPFARAVEASATYPGFASHPFPTCFVCGPQRDPGDGMRLFTGRLPNGDTATPWTVPADVSEPMVWASLDCPGGWSVGIESRPYVLGRMATHVEAVPAAGDECVVMGRRLDSAGRKAHVAAVLYGPDGTALAWSRATWIAIELT
ncbi:MAG TPA: hypothetical protein VGF84_12485 [Micromonosporaceae bacterium]|jgi:hypothetical protein